MTQLRCRSALFAPANRPELLDKLSVAQADVVIADLEGGVLADHDAKSLARDCLRRWSSPSDASGALRMMRINDPTTPWFDDDLELAMELRPAGVVVPKIEDAASVRFVRARLDGASSGRRTLIVAGLETARGVAESERIASSGAVDVVYFGAEDYVTDTGGRRTRSGGEVLYARSRVALAAALGRIPALDQVVIDLDDYDGFLADAMIGRDLGYAGKMCIHPRQVLWSHDVFTPTPDEVEAARRIVGAVDSAAAEGRGVVSVNGRMIDKPMIERARRLISQQERGTTHA